MIQNCFKVIVTTLLILTTSLFSRFSYSADLIEAYQDAFLSDPQFNAARFRQKVELGKKSEARSFLLPSLDASATIGEIRNESSLQRSSIISDGQGDSQGYRVQLTQLLYNKSLFADYSKAKLTSKLAEIELVRLEQDLMLRVVQAYFDVLQAIDDTRLAEINHDSAFRQYDQVRKLYNEGLANRAEFQQVLARWQVALAEKIQTTNDGLETKRILRDLTGKDYDSYSELDDKNSSIKLYTAPSAEWTDNVLLNNISYIQQKIRLSIAEKEIKVQSGKHFPEANFIVRRDKDINKGTFTNNLEIREDETFIGVQLSIPLFSGGLTRTRTNSARAERDAVKLDLESLRRTVLRKVESLKNQAASLDKVVEALGKSEEASRIALEIREEAFKLGLETNFNVIDAQREFFETSLGANRVRYEALLLGLQLEQLGGSLDIEDLKRVNQILSDSGGS